MYPRVFGEFRVEGCGHRASLPDGDWVGAFGCDHFNACAYALDLGGADEDHFEVGTFLIKRALQELASANRTVDLASVGIAADADIDRAQASLLRVLHFGSQQDCSGAGAEGRLEAHELFQLFETFFSEQFQERAGLAARDHEAVDFVELLRLFYEHNCGAQLFEPAAVGIEIALQGQDTDLHCSFDFTGRNGLPQRLKPVV